ncbi:MAG TPA: peptide chain release factor N(5)-glutamine methyltransferase [Fibrobacteria bacterium]|nr:peptide chain release factor N(5)-glutamine methyltransferase [Fibrobacteria bacterium]HOX51782.1 peptide chain release factor N(5)-glutamine methyltransferase [Fibrobacteria bacterium]
MSEPLPTLGEIQKRSEEFLARKGVENPRGNARRLLAKGLGITPMQVILQFDRPLTEPEIATLRALVVRRSQGEPLQHIEGSVAFRHLEILSDARALVPRPETEILVDLALERLAGIPKARVHEVGVGTGCVALSLRHERADLVVTGSDISPQALELAEENAKRLGIWVPLTQADLLEGVASETLDMVVSNPPYIARGDLAGLSVEVRADPTLALDGGPDGLDLVRRLVVQARDVLVAGGWLLVEHGFDQGPRTRELCAEGWTEVGTVQDLSGTDRFLVARKAGS